MLIIYGSTLFLIQDLEWITNGVYAMPWDMTTLNKQFSPLFMVQRCEWVCLLLLFWPVGYVVQAAAHCKGAHTGKVWSPCLTGPLSDLGLRCLHCYLCLQPQPCSQNEKIDLVGSK
jgi:hypothetical protein